jgi:hypothetical protein
MTDLKNSLLVSQQVPEFVREEHPLFVSFLEAYYEFLEQEQGTQNNDLTNVAKDMRYVSDVDYSIARFEQSFVNSFASLIPRDALVDKAFLIKNVLPLYLARGNEKSFEFLFRLLYNEEVEISYPKDNILKPSASTFLIENVLRINNDVYSFYTGDGITNTFLLAQQSLESDITVYVNDVLTTSGFYVRKEAKKIIFTTPPASGVDIKIYYIDFDETLFTSRQITGQSSGATALVERAAPRLITQQTAIELYINEAASLLGNFKNAETIVTNIIADDGVSLINVASDTISTLRTINVINRGSGYNVGDTVIISGGGFDTQAEAIVDSVSTGFANVANVSFGGAGFQLGGLIYGTTNTSAVLVGAVSTVDDSGVNTANSFSFFTDIIDPYANTSISSSNYGFPANVITTGENVSTRIIDALSKGTITGIGPITGFTILFSNTSTNNTILDADGAKFETLANTFLDIKSFHSLGRIRINNGGSGYLIGDEINFGSNPGGTYGIGAAAAVTNTSSTGAITKVELQPYRIAGTANTQSGNVQVVGTGTAFSSDLIVGDLIMINSEARYVNSITSATSLNVNVAFGRTSTNRKVGVHDRYLIGGQGYTQNNFPSITVSSSSGTNANLEIIALMGDGERLSASSNTVAGSILTIRVTNAGSGYEFLPAIDLTQSGNGDATAEAEIERSYTALPGRWITSESILSSFDTKVQGLDYYIDFVYVTKVAAEFSKYKNILKGLLHPAGFKNYAEYPINKGIDTPAEITSVKTTGVSGFISVSNGSITVTGTNTRFNVANTLGILTIGTKIVVNNQIRTVNSIISNTSLTVSNVFTTNATSQTVIILA